MINERLNEMLPALPEGWRWKVYRSKNRFVTRGYINYLAIQEKRLGLFWVTKADECLSEMFPQKSLDENARRLYNSFINTKTKEDCFSNLLGTTK